MITSEDFKSVVSAVWCNTCKRITNHVVKGTHTWSDQEEEEPGVPTGWWEDQTSELLVCAGCETAVLRVTYDNPAYQGDPLSVLHPKREVNQLAVKVFKKLPKKVRKIYVESVRAYNSDCLILCSVGLRAAIEGICNDKGVSGKNLVAKIDSLTQFLPKGIVDNLHGFRFMGNDAAHELESPKPEELRIAIEVCEDLMNYLYELDYKSSMLVRRKKSAEGAV